MSTILGLDMGTNSIGWALINNEEQIIIDAGVRIFEEGVNLEKGREESKNYKRRQARSIRKQYKRKRQRLNNLTTILKQAEMCPDQNESLPEYFKEDPYILRKKGLDEKLTLTEFGRCLYHLGRRRGFKSNRKASAEEKSNIFKGKEGIIGITQTEKEIEKSGCRTIGEYLAEINPHEERRRGRYLHRSMITKEFEYLWNKQREYYPEILEDKFKKDLEEAMFSQRKLKPQKWAVGICDLEKNEGHKSKKRTPVSTPVYQYFRILAQLSNIRITTFTDKRNNTLVTDDERKTLIDYLNNKEEITIKQIIKILKLPEGTYINLEKEHEKIIGNKTASRLLKVFGDAQWNAMSEQERENIWHTLKFAGDEQWVIQYAKKKWNLNEDNGKKLSDTSFENGYAPYSRRAIKKLIPYLEQGKSVTEAIKEAGYEENSIRTGLLEALPEPPKIRNPIVQKALYELKKLTNVIIKEYGKPDCIRVELIRDLKNPKKRREEIRSEQKNNMKENLEIIKILNTEFFIKDPGREDILKYKLWKECGRESVYSGKKIACSDLFTGEIDIDHILPYSRTLDDSAYNKTLCFRQENQEKGERTPYEAFTGDPSRYEEILHRIRSTSLRKKFELFTKKELDEDFISRQLNDTAYIAKTTREYLRNIVPDVQAVKGAVTAMLRQLWGLNGILGNTDIKIREDHRQHAIDALVIACTTPNFVKTLSCFNKYHKSANPDKFPLPWDNYWNDSEYKIKSIIVSHQVNKKARGELHKESLYGKINSKDYVKRVKLRDITRMQVEKIVDKKVKNQVMKEMEKYKNEINENKIPKSVFENQIFMPDGKTPIKKVRICESSSTMFALYNDNKRKVFVEPENNHHIAIFEDVNGKRDSVVTTLFEAVQRKRRKESIIQKDWKTGWRFIMSLSINELVLLDINASEIDWNSNVFIKKYGENIYRVQKISQNKQITFRKHYVAKLKNDEGIDIGVKRFQPSTLIGIKIKIDPIGRIIPAHD